MESIHLAVKKPPKANKKGDLAEVCGSGKLHRYPIVVIHGFGNSNRRSASMRKYLQRHEFEVYYIPLPFMALGDIRKNADLLEKKIAEIKILLGANHLNAICLDEGGITLRYTMEKLHGIPYIHKVIFLASPLKGTYMLLFFALFTAARQTFPHSSLFRDLQQEPIDQEALAKYHSIYPRYGLLMFPRNSYFLEGAKNFELSWFITRFGISQSRRVFTLVMDILETDIHDELDRESRYQEVRSRLEELDRAIEENPHDGSLFLLRGKFFLEMGYWSRAIKDLSLAIKLKQGLPEAFYLRALAYRRKIDYNENPIQNRAIADLTRTINMKPGFAEAYYQRGLCYALLGSWNDAMSDFDHALILNCDFYPAYLARGLGRKKMGDFRGALEDLREVLRLHPDSQDALHLMEDIRL